MLPGTPILVLRDVGDHFDSEFRTIVNLLQQVLRHHAVSQNQHPLHEYRPSTDQAEQPSPEHRYRGRGERSRGEHTLLQPHRRIHLVHAGKNDAHRAEDLDQASEYLPLAAQDRGVVKIEVIHAQHENADD